MNKKFNEYKSINYYELSSDILSFWKENNVFENKENPQGVRVARP